MQKKKRNFCHHSHTRSQEPHYSPPKSPLLTQTIGNKDSEIKLKLERK